VFEPIQSTPFNFHCGGSLKQAGKEEINKAYWRDMLRKKRKFSEEEKKGRTDRKNRKRS